MEKWFKDHNKINNGGEYENIAEKILQEIDLKGLEERFVGLAGIPKRTKAYDRTKCMGFSSNNGNVMGTEKRFCKCLFYSNYKGKTGITTNCENCHYEDKEWYKKTPLKGNFNVEGYEIVPTDKGAGIGNIDLLLSDNNYLYITEVKPKESKETLLRMVAEIETYYRVIKGNETFIKAHQEKPIRKAIMFFKDSEQSKQFNNQEYEHFAKNTKQIISLLGISVLEISLNNDKLTITAIG